MDLDEHYSNNKTFIIPNGGNYLLALMNSRTAAFFYHTYSGIPVGGFFAAQEPIIEKLPIPSLTPKQQEQIVKLVDQILAAKRDDSQANVSWWEREIDRLVYQLYELTGDAMAIVEGKT